MGASWPSFVVESVSFDIGGVVSVTYADQVGNGLADAEGAVPTARLRPGRFRDDARKQSSLLGQIPSGGNPPQPGQGVARHRPENTWQEAGRLPISVGDQRAVHSNHTRTRTWRRSARGTGRRSEKRVETEVDVSACGHDTVPKARPVPNVGFGVGTGARTASPLIWCERHWTETG